MDSNAVTEANFSQPQRKTFTSLRKKKSILLFHSKISIRPLKQRPLCIVHISFRLHCLCSHFSQLRWGKNDSRLFPQCIQTTALSSFCDLIGLKRFECNFFPLVRLIYLSRAAPIGEAIFSLLFPAWGPQTNFNINILQSLDCDVKNERWNYRVHSFIQVQQQLLRLL